VVQPSLPHMESFGMSVVEAMAKKKAVIVSDIGCFKEYIVDNVNGILFPTGDPRALSEKIGILMGDPGLRQRLGAAALATVQRRFDETVMTRATRDLYKEALALKGLRCLGDAFKEAIAAFMETAQKERDLSFEKFALCHNALERFVSFVQGRRLACRDIEGYLAGEDVFLIDTFVQFLDKGRVILGGTCDPNIRLFGRVIRARPVTPKDYDERIRMQTLDFQIDTYYCPKDKQDRRRIACILDALKPLPGERILDVGCGVGTFAYHCAKRGARTVGVDYSAASIETAVRLTASFGLSGKAQFVCRDATQPLAYVDGYFDKIVAADFIEHIDDEQKKRALAEMARLVKPGGIIVIFTPNAVREAIGSLKASLLRLWGASVPDTRLHYGLTNRFAFEKMIRAAGCTFTRRFVDVGRPYLAAVPLVNECLSLEILWVMRK